MCVCVCVLGAFEDSEVTHVEGEVNPVRDLEIISEELRLKDVQYLDKHIVSSTDCMIIDNVCLLQRAYKEKRACNSLSTVPTQHTTYQRPDIYYYRIQYIYGRE